jgi:hypothetical protein
MTVLIVRWVVQVRHGRGWREYPMEVPANSDLSAALDVRRSWGQYRRCRVRCAEWPDEWNYFRFKAERAYT